MKIFLGIITLVMLSTAQAQDLKFGDLNYFLKSGQINAGADLSIGNESMRREGTGDVRINGYFTDAKLAYGIMDQLNAFIKLQYLYAVDTEISGGSGSFDTTGFQNPEFGGQFRVLNQADAGFNFDLAAIVGLQVLERNAGSFSPQHDGDLPNPAYSTRGEPRNTLELNGRLGKKWNIANEFSVLAGVVYHQEGDYEDQENDGTATIESSIDLKSGVYYQYCPVDELRMGLGLTGIYIGETDGNNGNGLKATGTSHLDLKLSFDAKYLINEGLIVKFMMNQERRGDFEFETTSGDVSVEKRKSFNYGLGLDLLF